MTIKEICSETENYSFCSQVLSSNPQITNNKDIRGLAKISIDLAYASAKETSAIIEPLMKQESNSGYKEEYAFCSNNYGEAVLDLEDATRLLEKGDYKALHEQALSAMDAAEDCEVLFEVPPPPNDNSQLQEKIETFVNLCSINLAVSDRLQKL